MPAAALPLKQFSAVRKLRAATAYFHRNLTARKYLVLLVPEASSAVRQRRFQICVSQFWIRFSCTLCTVAVHMPYRVWLADFQRHISVLIR